MDAETLSAVRDRLDLFDEYTVEVFLTEDEALHETGECDPVLCLLCRRAGDWF